MIEISYDGTIIDETKIVFVKVTGNKSLEITLDNGKIFHTIDINYSTEKEKNTYLRDIREAIKLNEYFSKYNNIKTFDFDEKNVMICSCDEYIFNNILKGKVVIFEE